MKRFTDEEMRDYYAEMYRGTQTDCPNIYWSEDFGFVAAQVSNGADYCVARNVDVCDGYQIDPETMSKEEFVETMMENYLKDDREGIEDTIDTQRTLESL